MHLKMFYGSLLSKDKYVHSVVDCTVRHMAIFCMYCGEKLST
jgi:hypothetical protein